MEGIKKYKTLKEIVNVNFDIYKDKVAFKEKEKKDGEYEDILYSKVKEDINNLGEYFSSVLNLKDEKIALVGENSYRWYVTYMAAVCGSNIIVPLDKHFTDSEMIVLLNKVNPKVLVYSARKKEQIQNIKTELPKDIILIQINDVSKEDEVISIDAAIKEGKKVKDKIFENIEIDENKCCSILFTSGSYEKLNGVMLSHKNICTSVFACASFAHGFENYTTLSVLPMHHPYEFTLNYLYMTSVGATVGIGKGFKNLAENILEIKPDFMLTVPAIVERIAGIIDEDIKERGKEKTTRTLKSLVSGISKIGIDLRKNAFSKVHEAFGGNLKYIFCGAAPIELALLEKIQDFGFNIIQGYGLSECCSLVAATPLKGGTIGTVGNAVEGVDIRIDLSKSEDENSNVGEIIINSDSVMLGYYEDEEATKKVIKKGWLYTGDLGYFNIRGELVVTGRSKNVIVTQNGKNIYPEELEGLLNKLPLINESLVYGKKMKKNSKELTICARVKVDEAMIESKFGADYPDDAKLYELVFNEIKRVNRMMVSYKAIKELEIKKTEFARTPTMKIWRSAEIESPVLPEEMITSDALKKAKAIRKARRKPVEVEAQKVNDSDEILEVERKIIKK